MTSPLEGRGKSTDMYVHTLSDIHAECDCGEEHFTYSLPPTR